MIGELIAAIVIGIIAGYLGRALLPGPDPMGFVTTVAVGIVGALVGWLAFTYLLGDRRRGQIRPGRDHRSDLGHDARPGRAPCGPGTKRGRTQGLAEANASRRARRPRCRACPGGEDHGPSVKNDKPYEGLKKKGRAGAARRRSRTRRARRAAEARSPAPAARARAQQAGRQGHREEVLALSTLRSQADLLRLSAQRGSAGAEIRRVREMHHQIDSSKFKDQAIGRERADERRTPGRERFRLGRQRQCGAPGAQRPGVGALHRSLPTGPRRANAGVE